MNCIAAALGTAFPLTALTLVLSQDLPIRDVAEIVSDGDSFSVILVDTNADETCARLHIRYLAGFLCVLADIGAGKTVKAKDAAGRGL